MENNKEQINSSQKDAFSPISPENLNYIWFGVYNELMINENIVKILEKCIDKSLPKKSASIHLNKYAIAFNKNKIFIIYKENSSIFIKLYLIKKNQLIDILKSEYKCDKMGNELDNIFKLQNKNDEISLQQFQSESNFYNTIKNIGLFNKINILSVTSHNNMDLQPPDKEYLNLIYIGLKKSFYLYSDYLIMYYLYLNHEIKTTYSLKKLTELFFDNKINEKSQNNIIIKETDNQKQLLYFLPKNEKEKIKNKEDINEFNYLLNADLLPQFDETTGDFFWNNYDSNWAKFNEKIKNNEIINNKVINIEQGSIITIFNDFSNQNKKEDNDNTKKKNILKYIEELNSILDTK